MALNQILNFLSKILKTVKGGDGDYRVLNWKYFLYFFSVIIFFTIFIIISNLINQKNKIESQNLNSVVTSKEFSNLSNYFLSKINSPYKEVEYLIQANDSIEKILKKFDINSNDIKIISNNLKKDKLTNIYAGRTLSIILKKLSDGSNTVVNLVYPVNNTLNIEIRKSQDNFIVKENILKFYKKKVKVAVRNQLRLRKPKNKKVKTKS